MVSKMVYVWTQQLRAWNLAQLGRATYEVTSCKANEQSGEKQGRVAMCNGRVAVYLIVGPTYWSDLERERGYLFPFAFPICLMCPREYPNPHVETKVCANAQKRWQAYRSFFHLCLDSATWRSRKIQTTTYLVDSIRETCWFVKVRAWSSLEVSGSGKDLPCIQMATDEIINCLIEAHLISILIPKIAFNIEESPREQVALWLLVIMRWIYFSSTFFMHLGQQLSKLRFGWPAKSLHPVMESSLQTI
jgi:hypothetical protein